MESIVDILERTRIVAAVKDDNGLMEALRSDCEIVFVLYGDLCSITRIVDTIKNAGRLAIVHINLIEGLTGSDVAVRYIRENTAADGIISTKYAHIRLAKSLGLMAIQRYFIIDSIALSTCEKQLEQGGADIVEVLPGAMPKIIARIAKLSSVPVIASGLIADKEDIQSALDSGAIAISSTNHGVWFM